MISKCSKPITIKRQGQEKGWKKKEWVTCYNAVMPYPLKEVAARTIFAALVRYALPFVRLLKVCYF